MDGANHPQIEVMALFKLGCSLSPSTWLRICLQHTLYGQRRRPFLCLCYLTFRELSKQGHVPPPKYSRCFRHRAVRNKIREALSGKPSAKSNSCWQVSHRHNPANSKSCPCCRLQAIVSGLEPQLCR